MRSTKQRNLILEIINNNDNHFSAEEIYQIARQKILNISLGTVYRNLRLLDKDGKIKCLKGSDGIDRFDHLKTRHNHFVCSRCGKYYDLYDNFDISLKNKSLGIVLDYEIQFNGICNDCIMKEEKENGIERKQNRS